MLEISICAVRHIIFLQDKCAVFHVPKLDQKKTINHVTAWERKQSSDILLSPHPSPPAPPQAPGSLKVSLFSPNLWVFSTTFGDATASREEEGRIGGKGRRLGLRGESVPGGGGGGLGPAPPPAPPRGVTPAGLHRPPLGAAESGHWALPRAQSDKKGCAPPSRVPSHGRHSPVCQPARKS